MGEGWLGRACSAGSRETPCRTRPASSACHRDPSGAFTPPAPPPNGKVQEEKARRAARQQSVLKLRGDREVQLEEQANRKQAAAELRRRGEEELTARIALDVKRQIEVGGRGKLDGAGWGTVAMPGCPCMGGGSSTPGAELGCWSGVCMRGAVCV